MQDPAAKHGAAGTIDDVYPRPGSTQSAGWLYRLRRRRITPRLLLAYTGAAIILLFAAPMLAYFVIGAITVALGVMLRLWTFGYLRKNHSLATTGPYAHTRNPAYLGSGIAMVGLFLAAGNPTNSRGLIVWALGLIAILVFFGAYLPRKYAREYGQLEKIFPKQIRRHAAHVPNFFPRLTPWRSGDDTRFSWHCVRANNEWVWAPASALALCLILLHMM